MKRRRVKITGIGPVTPAGIGKDEFWKGILEPVSRVQPYKDLGEEYGPFVAAYVDQFNIAKYVERVALPKGAAPGPAGSAREPAERGFGAAGIAAAVIAPRRRRSRKSALAPSCSCGAPLGGWPAAAPIGVRYEACWAMHFSR